MKAIKGWRTLAVGAIVTLLPILDFSLNNSAIMGLIPEAYREVSVSALGLLMIILRMLTSTPPMDNGE